MHASVAATTSHYIRCKMNKIIIFEVVWHKKNLRPDALPDAMTRLALSILHPL